MPTLRDARQTGEMVPKAPITMANTRNPNRKIAILPITASDYPNNGSDVPCEGLKPSSNTSLRGPLSVNH